MLTVQFPPGDDVPAIDFAFAFQPIVSVRRQQIVAHEALARGPVGQPAVPVPDQVTHANRLRFNQDCKSRAITQAVSLDIDGALSINFIPNAVVSVPNASARPSNLPATAAFRCRA